MAPPEDKESFAALFERSAGATLRQHRFRAGERVEVTIVAVSRDAVFADLGSKQEGYFDRPDLTGPDGTLGVAVGARVAAVVANVDDAKGQIRLSPIFVRNAASQGEDRFDDQLGVSIPVARSGPLLVEGARVTGKVTGVERYGLFVQINGTSGRGGRGLVPTAETGTPRGADLRKLFPEGQEITAKIVSIADDGKIRLSITAARQDEERGEYEAYRAAGEASGAEASEGSSKAKPKQRAKPEPRNFGTLGDLLSKRVKK